MTSKTSFINRGIMLNDLKRFWWIGAGYLLGMLSLPLAIHSAYTQIEKAVGTPNYQMLVNQLLQIFQLTAPRLQPVLIVLVPIATGLILFQYLQDGRAADMFHALPVKRSTLYNTHILSGLLFLILPLLITGLISWALIAGLGIPHIGLLTVLTWLGFALLFNLLFFLISVAVGMVTGISIVQGALSLLLLLLPSVLYTLMLAIGKIFIYGFANEYYLMRMSRAISPLFQMHDVVSIQAGTVTGYLLACAILYLAGLYLYKQRRLDAAGNAIIFGFLQPVFKYGVAFCAALPVGWYFSSIQNGNTGWADIGFFLGSLVAYFLCEALLRKSPFVFHRKAIQGYGVFAVVMALLVVWLQFGTNGFEQSLPDLSQVESVYLGNVFSAPGADAYPTVVQGWIAKYSVLTLPLPVYKNEDSIADIYALNQALIANWDREKALRLLNKDRRSGALPLCLVYNLKNGNHFVREYYINPSDYAKQLKPLYESREYKYLNYPILSVSPSDVVEMSITQIQSRKSVYLADQDQLQQVVTALQKDIMQQTYEEIISEQPDRAFIDIMLNNNQMTEVDWDEAYVNFWYQLQNDRVYGKIQYCLVIKTNRNSSTLMDNPKNPLALEKNPDCLKVADPVQLEVCLLRYTNGQSQQPYQVLFVLEGGNTFSGVFSEADAPDFVKQYFARSEKTTPPPSS
jgi:ABC-2 type transport system permease protein